MQRVCDSLEFIVEERIALWRLCQVSVKRGAGGSCFRHFDALVSAVWRDTPS